MLQKISKTLKTNVTFVNNLIFNILINLEPMFCLCFDIAAFASASVWNVTSAYKKNFEMDFKGLCLIFAQIEPDRSTGSAIRPIHDVDFLATCTGAEPFRDLHLCCLSVKSV